MARCRPAELPSFPHYGKTFSTPWKKCRPFFHTVEKPAPIFPRNGKTLRDFSTQWKKFDGFFHTMENLWGDFSTQWKMFDDFFHTVEKIFPHCGKVSRGRVAAGRAA